VGLQDSFQAEWLPLITPSFVDALAALRRMLWKQPDISIVRKARANWENCPCARLPIRPDLRVNRIFGGLETPLCRKRLSELFFWFASVRTFFLEALFL
jgi:hypothetical protein